MRLGTQALTSLLGHLLGHPLQDQPCGHSRLLADQHAQFHGGPLLLRHDSPQHEAMSAAREECGSHRQSHQIRTPLALDALMPLPHTPLFKEALIAQVQPSGWHFLLLERTLGISLSPIGEQRPLQVPREHIPTHEQLEPGPTRARTASPSAPHLRQVIGQADPTAIFHDHGREALEQRHGGRLCLQAHLGQPLQEPTQKLRRRLRKALMQATRRDLDLTPPGHLRQAV